MAYHPGHIYHIYNQGNNRQEVFLDREDYLTFLRLLRIEFAHSATLMAWCLMPNHFHLMLQVHPIGTHESQDPAIKTKTVSESLRQTLSSYTRIVNKRRGTSGSVFRQGTKHNCLDDSQASHFKDKTAECSYLDCFLYIHRNPLKASLVDDLKDWEFSSYREFAGLRNGSLVDSKMVFEFLGVDREEFILECTLVDR